MRVQSPGSFKTPRVSLCELDARLVLSVYLYETRTYVLYTRYATVHSGRKPKQGETRPRIIRHPICLEFSRGRLARSFLLASSALRRSHRSRCPVPVFLSCTHANGRDFSLDNKIFSIVLWKATYQCSIIQQLLPTKLPVFATISHSFKQ